MISTEQATSDLKIQVEYNSSVNPIQTITPSRAVSVKNSKFQSNHTLAILTYVSKDVRDPCYHNPVHEMSSISHES